MPATALPGCRQPAATAPGKAQGQGQAVRPAWPVYTQHAAIAQARAGKSQSYCSSCEKMLIVDSWARFLLIPELGFAEGLQNTHTHNSLDTYVCPLMYHKSSGTAFFFKINDGMTQETSRDDSVE